MDNMRDFVIKSGVLTKYTGAGGDVVIPEGVKTIGQRAFVGCVGLTSVTISEGVKKIGESAFFGCIGLTSVTIPEGAKEIGWSAFEGCVGLTSVTISEGVKEIGESAFFGCTGLTSVTIPEEVTEIGWDAFFKTPWQKGLGEFAIVNHVLLKYQGNGGDIIIPEDVTKIEEYAFDSCIGLTNVTIPEGIRLIGRYAFSGCTGLTSVVIPKSIKKIDKSWFAGCPIFALIAPHIPIEEFAPEYRPSACCGFAVTYLEGQPIEQKIRDEYLKYIKNQKKKLYPAAGQHEKLLQLMIAKKMLIRNDINPLLEECDKKRNTAAKAALLDYINKNLKPVDPLEEFKL